MHTHADDPLNLQAAIPSDYFPQALFALAPLHLVLIVILSPYPNFSLASSTTHAFPSALIQRTY